MKTSAQHLSKRNRIVGLAVFAGVCSMVGLAYASVPLYRLFCQATGYGGTPQVAGVDYDRNMAHSNSMMKVRFNGDVNASLNWAFHPEIGEIKIPLGQPTLAAFKAQNLSDETITGTATFNVTPMKAAPYFNKIDCFCFTEQTLTPGQTVDMPVSFYVDPEILNDPNVAEVKTITLSYTFFKAMPKS